MLSRPRGKADRLTSSSVPDRVDLLSPAAGIGVKQPIDMGIRGELYPVDESYDSRQC
jgi:hypothetical protein